ncbi:DUF4446 family protein [Actinocorallia sp. A-T 12471]|uniref:DUF4446 family protein n=1 Tax=Actinocorallia sp. A-T 12471 TaxID=3089813 RepID=UPI0029CD0CC6|nr:DUF4446 family protein [Actinocorallia sp. A-T 12471]MDX6742074.1 DUF4446 family protein [Actinocorallia sp. A-T 12471]
MLITVAVVGALSGLAGLSMALVARSRVSRVVEECADVLRRQMQVATGVDKKALRDLAIVRYDALAEMSGELSFSLAVLDAAGDGVVISSINGRSETRTYAKVVQGGRSPQMLSPEEEHALRAARLGRGPVVEMDDPLADFGAPVGG